MATTKLEVSGDDGIAQMPPTEPVRFLLNGRAVEALAHPATLVLDFLRRSRGLIGTKEGCREGDCGACVALIGRLEEGGGVVYRPVTTCLMPVAELQGKHLVTIEGLDLGRASPVQQEVIQAGASQCGFCTPGIIVSLTAMTLDDDGDPSASCGYVSPGQAADEARVDRALSGHLCRCTGYRSLREAGARILERRAQVRGGGASMEQLIAEGWLPSFLSSAEAELRALNRSSPEPTFGDTEGELLLGGGTDLYVQQGDRLPMIPVRALGLNADLRGVQRRDGRLELGAQVTFEELAQNPHLQRLVPGIERFMLWIASLQVRHRATLAGNLVNASPIGDVTVLMLALGAVIRCRRGESGESREMALERLYLGYKNLDLRPDELVTRVILDETILEGSKVDFQKVSKRRCLDIATVNSALGIRVEDGRIARCRWALGGVAPIPLFLAEASEWAEGRPLTVDTVAEMIEVGRKRISPIDDVRGSAVYKSDLCGRLLVAHFLELFPQALADSDLMSVVDRGDVS